MKTEVHRLVTVHVFPIVAVVQSDNDEPATWADVEGSADLMRYLHRARVVVGADRHGKQGRLLKDNLGIGAGVPVRVRDILNLEMDE
jgi:hypothetical protein